MKGKHLPHWLGITIGARPLTWCLLITHPPPAHAQRWNEKALCAEGLCAVPMVPFVPLLLISKHTHKLLNFFCLFSEKPELGGSQCGTVLFLRVWPRSRGDFPAQMVEKKKRKAGPKSGQEKNPGETRLVITALAHVCGMGWCVTHSWRLQTGRC